MPKIEISGSDATNAAAAGAFRPINAISATIRPDSRARVMNAAFNASGPLFEKQSHAVGFADGFIFRLVYFLQAKRWR